MNGNPVKKVVLSGIRATGRLHLGNYLGVLGRFAEMSEDPQYSCYFFVADWHTLTTLDETSSIKNFLSDIILDYLAAGVNPEKATIFVQSNITATAELFWILSCLTPKAELERVPTFKEKAQKQPENVNAGLLNYPVLMAADILGPKANLVPVGKDQLPHLEMTAQIARRFNRIYGEFFPIPDAMVGNEIIVPGLDGTGKMGKSEGNAINLTDGPEVIRRKVKIGVTDPARKRRTDCGDPQKCNIFALHTLISKPGEIAYCSEGCRTAAIGCLECKGILANNIIALLQPFQDRRRDLENKPRLIEGVLAEGNIRAASVIQQTVSEVREKIGLIYATK